MLVISVKVLCNYLRNSLKVHSTYSAFLLITTTTANNNILRIIGLPRTSRNCIKHTSGYHESSIRTDGGGYGADAAAAGSYWGRNQLVEQLLASLESEEFTLSHARVFHFSLTLVSLGMLSLIYTHCPI